VTWRLSVTSSTKHVMLLQQQKSRKVTISVQSQKLQRLLPMPRVSSSHNLVVISAHSPAGHSINVLHLSDWHMDPRYDIGSEANCSQYLCCRPYSTNKKLNTVASNASVPASRFGYFFCDTPPDLAVSSFASMSQFFDLDNVSFGIFTGDIVTHDNPDQVWPQNWGVDWWLTY